MVVSNLVFHDKKLSWKSSGHLSGHAIDVYQNRSAECPALKNVRSKKGGSGGLRPPDVDTILLFWAPPVQKTFPRHCVRESGLLVFFKVSNLLCYLLIKCDVKLSGDRMPRPRCYLMFIFVRGANCSCLLFCFDVRRCSKFFVGGLYMWIELEMWHGSTISFCHGSQSGHADSGWLFSVLVFRDCGRN